MARQIKLATDCPLVTTLTTGQQLLTTGDGGRVNRIGLDALTRLVLGGRSLDALTSNVFIMFHRRSDNYPLMVSPSQWPSYQNNGEIADGVTIVEGGKILVVAVTETQLYWSSTAVNSGGFTTADRVAAINDWNGKTSTAAQITHSECNTASYAPGYCNLYSRTNANGYGLTAGKWWLPSLGELLMIYANIDKINYALSLINGAQLFSTKWLASGNTWYHSSTEYSSQYSYFLDFHLARNGYTTKHQSNGRVRPVSTFIA